MEKDIENISLHLAETYKSGDCEGVLDCLMKLTAHFKTAELRTQYKIVHQQICTILTEYYSKEDGLSKEQTRIVAETLKCLRNAVASSQNQDLCLHTSEFFTIVEKLLRNSLALCNNEDENSKDEAVQVLRCGMQFMGNAIVQNPAVKSVVWNSLEQDVCKYLQCSDETVSKYCTMVVYNCLYEMPDNVNGLLAKTDFTKCLVAILTKKDFEWSLFILEYLLEYNEFITRCFPLLEPESRDFVLQIIHDKVSKSNEFESHVVDILQHVGEMFVNDCDIFYHSENLDDKDKIQGILTLLDILTSASATDHYRPILQEKSSLIVSAVLLLKAVHKAGKEGNATFSPAARMSRFTKETMPVTYGFKRDLVSLIANLAFKNKRNQDEVRELDGIYLLLDCADLDGQNKFITEWVILAVRNLSENNLENQAVIAALKKQDPTVGKHILHDL